LTVTSYVLRVSAVTGEDGTTYHGGAVLVSFNQYDDYLPGDRVTLRGTLDEPGTFDDFDYRGYLADRGIPARIYRPAIDSVAPGSSSPSRWLTSLRLKLDRSLQRSLPEPESSLAAGIAFGRDDGLAPDVKDDFNRSGLRHLVAVSGSNVTLVTALIYLLAIPAIGRRWAWLPAGVAIVAYLAVAGLAPSVVRAGIMAVIFLAGSVAGRPQSGLPGLVAAAMLMTALSPGLATDVGFLLSATSTAGIIVFYPHVHRAVRRATAHWKFLAAPEWVCQTAALSVSATIATTPISWVVFGRISFVSPIANLIAEPFFVLAFWTSVLTAGAGLASGTVGVWLGAATYYPLAFITRCAATLASVPGSTVDVSKGSPAAALGAYLGLGALGLFAYRFQGAQQQEQQATTDRRHAANRFVLGGAVGATLVAVVPISLLPARHSSELRVAFLDVGQGDAALITTPHGKQVVIDGGPSGLALVRDLSAVMPHWDRSVDAVVLSHPQEDHVAGLVELERRFSVGAVFDNGRDNSTGTFGYYEDAFASRQLLVSGSTIVIDGTRFEVLWPPADFVTDELNDTSLIVRISYGDRSILFTGDAEDRALSELAAESTVDADVLKVPHHGSKTTGAWFFDAVHPSVAVISVGAGNQFGHPSPETLAALSPYQVLRTDEHGTITIATDGRSLKVSSER
jgi:competence protein ComEC